MKRLYFSMVSFLVLLTIVVSGCKGIYPGTRSDGMKGIPPGTWYAHHEKGEGIIFKISPSGGFTPEFATVIGFIVDQDGNPVHTIGTSCDILSSKPTSPPKYPTIWIEKNGGEDEVWISSPTDIADIVLEGQSLEERRIIFSDYYSFFPTEKMLVITTKLKNNREHFIIESRILVLDSPMIQSAPPRVSLSQKGGNLLSYQGKDGKIIFDKKAISSFYTLPRKLPTTWGAIKW